MKANYHTHTARCGHADGPDEAYVRAAIAQGFSELGFSDHIPWPYRSGYTHPGVRMRIDQLDEYVGSIRALAAQYADRICVRVGFESEYFPEYMGWLTDMVQQKRLDYLILGNHYDGSDETGMYFGQTRTPAELAAYVRSTIDGLRTGLFAYLAHPDLFMRGYPHFDQNCRAAAHELAQACRALEIPMEYNLHERFWAPVTHRKSYPNEAFFDIVRSEGVKVIIGLDAHEPREFLDAAHWARAERELEGFDRLACLPFAGDRG